MTGKNPANLRPAQRSAGRSDVTRGRASGSVFRILLGGRRPGMPASFIRPVPLRLLSPRRQRGGLCLEGLEGGEALSGRYAVGFVFGAQLVIESAANRFTRHLIPGMCISAMKCIAIVSNKSGKACDIVTGKPGPIPTCSRHPVNNGGAESIPG